jgi:prepilin peptidase dependent protein B
MLNSIGYLSSFRSISGFTLVELMISLSLSSVMISSAFALLVSSTHQLSTVEEQLKVHNDLLLVSNVIETELSNAGQVQRNGIDFLDNIKTPFHGYPIISAFDNESANSCITFNVDINADGQLNHSSPNEQRGFRLRDNAIEMRLAGRECHESGWQDLTSTDFVHIDSLTFEYALPLKKETKTNAITVKLTGKSRLKPSISSTITRRIILRNQHD